jgi:hypothetical protein
MAKNDKTESKTETSDAGANPPAAAPPAAAPPAAVDGATAGENGGAPPPPPPPAPALVHPYQVAPGKALTVKRGVLNEGDAITLADLDASLKKPGSSDDEKRQAAQKQLDHLVARGFVVQGPAQPKG